MISDETPSLLPEGAVAVRFHSIGGWGAITTGKNLGANLQYEKGPLAAAVAWQRVKNGDGISSGLIAAPAGYQEQRTNKSFRL